MAFSGPAPEVRPPPCTERSASPVPFAAAAELPSWPHVLLGSPAPLSLSLPRARHRPPLPAPFIFHPPQIINGRLAMLAFVAALGAELSSGESVLRQVADAPALIGITFALFIAASIIPIVKNAKREALGPFTPAAELLNGRAAMLGFASLLAVEVLRGNGLPLF